MGDISKHFSRYEFACKCGCGFSTADIELISVLEDIRLYWNVGVHIRSGCRCRKHNTYVTSNPDSTSKHMEGIAVDFYVTGQSPSKIYKWLDNLFPDKYGLGNGKSFTHLDVRKSKARWAY